MGLYKRAAHVGAGPVDDGGAAGEQLEVVRAAGLLADGAHRERARQVAERHQHKERRQHLPTRQPPPPVRHS